jgi:hypothetical protein
LKNPFASLRNGVDPGGVMAINYMKKLKAISFIVLSGSCVNAQGRPEKGIWTAINLHINFSKHWQWHNDGGYRTLGVSVEPLQYLYRTGIRYNFNRHTSTAAGVAFFFTKTNFDKTQHEFAPEFRFWQEVVTRYGVNKKSQLLLRFRAEQRFFSATTVKSEYIGYRFRFRPGLNQKLNDKWSLQLTNEYLGQIADHRFSFDQNRLTLSGIYQFNRSAQCLVGYIWLKWPHSHQNILTFTVTKIILLNAN